MMGFYPSGRTKVSQSNIFFKNPTFTLIIDLSPSNLFLDDQASTALVLNGVDLKEDLSPGRDLFSNDGIINPYLEDPLFDSFDGSYFSDRIPDGSEIALNSCASNFSPSRKARKRENADECSSPNSEDSTPKLPSLDSFDLLQEAQKRRWCSKTGLTGVDFFTLVCAYSGSRADEDTYWHVSGYLCESSLPKITMPSYRDGSVSTDEARHYF